MGGVADRAGAGFAVDYFEHGLEEVLIANGLLAKGVTGKPKMFKVHYKKGRMFMVCRPLRKRGLMLQKHRGEGSY